LKELTKNINLKERRHVIFIAFSITLNNSLTAKLLPSDEKIIAANKRIFFGGLEALLWLLKPNRQKI
jgi:hypothetical protein